MHKYDKLETTHLKMEIERLAVFSDYCLQNLGQPWDVHIDRLTNEQGKNECPADDIQAGIQSIAFCKINHRRGFYDVRLSCFDYEIYTSVRINIYSNNKLGDFLPDSAFIHLTALFLYLGP